MRNIIIIFAFLMLFPVCILAQEHHHSHVRNEIGISPGVTFFKHDDEHEHGDSYGDGHGEHVSKARFSIHFEVGYDLIHLKHFHFGPAIDYSWSKHDSHFMLGVHCAYAF